MKYDLVIGNPPYGKNANLAIEFLNKAKDWSDHIVMILPRTIRKPVVLNQIDPHLHLESDVTNADDSFSNELYTCSQVWKVKDTKRPKVERYTKEMVEHLFEFTTKKRGDIAITRVGRAQTGQVFIKGKDYGHLKSYNERSSGTHYFIKVHNRAVIKELMALYDKFYAISRETVGQRSLSIDDLVRIYVETYCEI